MLIDVCNVIMNHEGLVNFKLNTQLYNVCNGPKYYAMFLKGISEMVL